MGVYGDFLKKKKMFLDRSTYILAKFRVQYSLKEIQMTLRYSKSLMFNIDEKIIEK